MAYAILGSPKPAFFDSSGSPLASGTITTQNPSDSAVKASYPTAADADAGTNGTSSDITLDARGEPTSTQYWGKDNEDYKVIIKDSAAATVYTLDAIQMPQHSRRATVTFTGGDTTPSVAESNLFLITAAVVITDFDDGEIGDVITVSCSTAAKVQISNSSTIGLRGSAAWNMITGSTLTLVMITDQVWTEIARTERKKTTVFKLADESLTSSTLAADTHLKDFDLVANTFYKLSGYLHVTADAGARDLEIDFITDNAFVEEMYSFVTIDAGSALTVDEGETQPLTTAVAVIDIDGTGNVGIMISGFVLTHADNTSNVDVHFANQAGAGTVTVQTGSWISFEPQVQ